jgi:hypothetical protein
MDCQIAGLPDLAIGSNFSIGEQFIQAVADLIDRDVPRAGNTAGSRPSFAAWIESECEFAHYGLIRTAERLKVGLPFDVDDGPTLDFPQNARSGP